MKLDKYVHQFCSSKYDLDHSQHFNPVKDAILAGARVREGAIIDSLCKVDNQLEKMKKCSLIRIFPSTISKSLCLEGCLESFYFSPKLKGYLDLCKCPLELKLVESKNQDQVCHVVLLQAVLNFKNKCISTCDPCSLNLSCSPCFRDCRATTQTWSWDSSMQRMALITSKNICMLPLQLKLRPMMP